MCKVAVRAELVRTKGDVAAAKTLMVPCIANVLVSQGGCHRFVSIYCEICQCWSYQMLSSSYCKPIHYSVNLGTVDLKDGLSSLSQSS